MAHQAHNLPWQTLAANFDQRRLARHRYLLGPLNKPHQAKQITHFTIAFARTLAEFSVTERRKYSPPIGVRATIGDDDELVSRTAVRRINDYFDQIRLEAVDTKVLDPRTQTLGPFPLLHKPWQRYSTLARGHVMLITKEDIAAYDEELRNHRDAPLSARRWKDGDWWHGPGKRTDVLTMWLILGEMETLLKIAQNAPETVKYSWNWGALNHIGGLKRLMERTVDFYLGLNVLYCKPEWYAEGTDAWQSYFDEHMVQGGYGETEKLELQRTGWPFSNPNGPLTTGVLPSPASVPIKFTRRKDYRSTPIYQAMVSARKDHDALGDCNNPLEPGYAWAIPHWQFFSYNAIIGYGGWPGSSQTTPADPLRYGGGQRLKDYLKVCWELLVRLDVFMRELDVYIDWQQVVSQSIANWYPAGVGLDQWYVSEERLNSNRVFDITRYGGKIERFV